LLSLFEISKISVLLNVIRDIISDRQIGQISICDTQLSQNPVCLHGINLIVAVASKQSVHESSVTLNLRNSSRYK
jgi:hypothetical protein